VQGPNDAGGMAPLGAPGESGALDFALRNEAMAMLRHKAGLIVDPNAASRSALRAMLSAIGMVQVVQASGATDAVRRVKERPADVILCDYLLEDGRDGQQLLEEMRSGLERTLEELDAHARRAAAASGRTSSGAVKPSRVASASATSGFSTRA